MHPIGDGGVVFLVRPAAALVLLHINNGKHILYHHLTYTSIFLIYPKSWGSQEESGAIEVTMSDSSLTMSEPFGITVSLNFDGLLSCVMFLTVQRYHANALYPI